MPRCLGYLERSEVAPTSSKKSSVPIDGTLSCQTCLSQDSSSSQCFWYSSRASCSWRSENEFDGLDEQAHGSTACRSIESTYNAPTKDWSFLCENGGILSSFHDGQKITGASCDCPKNHLWIGNKCEICATHDACRLNVDGPKELEPPRHCAKGVMPDPGETRRLSCDCTSEFCSLIGFNVGVGKIQVTASSKSKTSNSAIVELLKSVPSPSEGNNHTLGSPYLLRGHLEECTGTKMPCSQVCGNSKCPENVVWKPTDVCLVYECAKGKMECPNLSASWTVYRQECAPVKALFRAPFQFVCVDDPFSSDMKCGFSTYLLSHGSLSLTCQSGACVDGPDKNQTELPILRDWCPTQGSSGEICRDLMYSGILIIPLTLVVVLALIVRHVNRDLLPGAFTKKQSSNTSISSEAVDHYAQLVENNNDLLDHSEIHDGTNDVGVHTRILDLGDDLGDHTLINDSSASVRRRKAVWLAFENVTYSFVEDDTKNERRVLNSVAGHIAGYEMCGLLGPSGSGKTSLIDILTGRKNTGRFNANVQMSGEVSVLNDLSPSIRRSRIAVVLQDESLPSTSTVREYLLFHALCRRSHNKTTIASIVNRVDDTIKVLKLESCANRLIGDLRHGKCLSGGERRRTSLGVELLDDTRDVVVMDEPCTGLDSTSAQAVIDALRIIADSGKALLISIHSPSVRIYNSFDRVAILTQNGTCVYFGKRVDLTEFAATLCGLTIPTNSNPAEFIMDELCYASVEITDRVRDLFEASVYRIHEIDTLRSLQQISLQERSFLLLRVEEGGNNNETFLPLLSRSFRNAFRHPVLAATNVSATLFTSILCGLLYRGVTNDLQGAINRAGLFFFLCAYLTLASLADVGAWHDERISYVREKSTGSYDAGAYFFAKLIGEILPLRMVTLALSSLILTWLVGLNPDPRAVVLMYFLLLLVSVVSTMEFLFLGSLVGSVLKSPRQADHACVSLACFNMLLSGFLLSFDGVKSDASSNAASFIRFLSPIQFVFQSLMVNEISSLTFEIEIKAPKGGEGDEVVTKVSATGSLILANLGFDPSMLGMNVLFSIGFTMIVCFINYAALKWIATEMR